MQVILHVYDLSGGLAKQMSQSFLGKQIDGIWHTGVVVYGKEWFYGGGIQSDHPGRTPYGVPIEKIDLGVTQIPEDVFMEFLQDISPRFAMDKYDLLDNNCNDFSNEAAVFLTGNGIPDKVSGLPGEVLNSPLGPMIKQMISRFQQTALDSGWQGTGPPPLNPVVASQVLGGAAGAQQRGTGVQGPGANVSGGGSDTGQREGDERGSGGAGLEGGAQGGEGGVRSDHPHTKLLLPTLSQFNRPFLLTQRGDEGKTAIGQLKSLQAATFRDKGTQCPPEEVAALDQLEAYLAKDPAGPAESLPRPCYRFMARVLAEWPVKSWGPALDVFRLMLLYQPINRHYANSAGNPLPIIVKRCLSASDAVPRPVKIRALFAITNVFAHPEGTAAATRAGAVGELIEANLEMLGASDAAVRMSAAAILYNVALQLPKQASMEVVQMASGLGHLLAAEKDKDTAFRMLLALGKLAYCNTEAVQLLQSLGLQLNVEEWGGSGSEDGRVKAAAELKLLIGTE